MTTCQQRSCAKAVRRFAAVAGWVTFSVAAATAPVAEEPFALRLEGLSPAVVKALNDARATAERQFSASETPQARAEVWGRLGMFYHAQHLNHAAERAYGLALAEADVSQWRYLRAIVLEERGESRRAVADYRRVTEADPSNVAAQLRLAAGLRLQGDDEGAARALEIAEEHAPDTAVVLVAQADVAAARGQLRTAVDFLERAWPLAPGAGQIAYKLAMLKRRLGDAEGAKRWLARRGNDNAAPEIDDPVLLQVAQLSRSARFFVKAGEWALERGDEEGATEALATARKLAPENSDIALSYAHMLAIGGHPDDALGEVRRVLQADEQSARGWYLLAWLLRLSIDPDERRQAADAANRSLTLAEDQRTRALSAALAMRDGRFASAAADYGRLIAADEGNADHHYWLAMAKLGGGDCTAPISFERALQLRPSWGEAHLALARAEAICGAGDAAASASARRRALALVKAQNDVDTRLTLAIAELAAGNVERASILAQAERPHPDALLILAAIERGTPPTRPFAETSRWWQPEQVRTDEP